MAIVRLVCPVAAEHGRVLDWPSERWSFFCSHADHDGRPKTHPLGPSSRTRAFFRTEEVERGQLDEAAR